MVSASHFLRFIGSIALLISTTQQLSIPSTTDNDLANSISPKEARANRRPFYVIAHRVLTKDGIDAALDHGANSLEIDMTAWSQGWWADHDGTQDSWRDSAIEMFKKIVEVRKAGKSMTFVWLDIKNPDWCDPNDPKWRHCSVAGLRDLAREYLQPAGVRVLFGYILGANSKTYPFIRDSLNSNEAINLDGDPKAAFQRFQNGGPTDKSKRVSSYGFTELPEGFGNCWESSYYTCTELRQARMSGNFGQVFGWTLSVGQSQYVEKELGDADVDGLIYGFKREDYNNTGNPRTAAVDILNWVNNHPDRRFVATNNDPPW